MPFQHDSRGIDPNGGRRLLPEDRVFSFQITKADERKSKNGNDMLNLTCKVINDPEYAGTIVYHNVTFLAAGEKGAGMSVHIRKCLGLPYGSQDLVDGNDWVGKEFAATTIVTEFNGKKKSELAEISSPDLAEDAPESVGDDQGEPQY